MLVDCGRLYERRHPERLRVGRMSGKTTMTNTAYRAERGGVTHTEVRPLPLRERGVPMEGEGLCSLSADDGHDEQKSSYFLLCPRAQRNSKQDLGGEKAMAPTSRSRTHLVSGQRNRR